MTSGRRTTSIPPPVWSVRSEVKGLWFVSARRLLAKRYGDEILAAVIAAMPPELRDAMAAPLPSEWYPEEALQEALRVVHQVVAMGSADRMLQLLEDCTLVGINHFWRTALRVASAEFSLRALPATWKHMRRGPGVLAVDVAKARGVIRYTRFPYFDDVNYRLLVLGAVGPLLSISTGSPARLKIVDYGATHLTAEADLS